MLILFLSQVTVRPSEDVNITWLLQALRETEGLVDFTIDRSNPKVCHTPRRNPDVEEALQCFRNIFTWANHVAR